MQTNIDFVSFFHYFLFVISFRFLHFECLNNAFKTLSTMINLATVRNLFYPLVKSTAQPRDLNPFQ